MKRGLANIAVHDVGHLAELVKHRLRACQRHTDLLAGFLAQTGMTLEHRDRLTKPNVSPSTSVALTALR